LKAFTHLQNLDPALHQAVRGFLLRMIMKKTHHIVLTRAARDTGIPVDELHHAAASAAGDAAIENTWFKAFRVRGRQFALSTRIVVEVDHFPHKAPAGALSKPSQRSR
jgi:hypothetical protein